LHYVTGVGLAPANNGENTEFQYPFPHLALCIFNVHDFLLLPFLPGADGAGIGLTYLYRIKLSEQRYGVVWYYTTHSTKFFQVISKAI
ncbi:MAG: hypothetical protein ACJ748_15070, partial [Flavisolibacter sp.]